MQNMKTQKHIYTITELTRQIRVVLEDTFSRIWVEGEVSNFIKHSSGHMYFSLKDKNSVLSCVLFRNQNQNLKFKIENGLHVVSFGRISLYDKRGQYQLYVDKIEPKGLGALQLAFEQLKDRLKKIGVVTSPTGAAIRDILKVTGERFQNINVIISPVRVQGKGAELEIAQAIKDFNDFSNIDVLIVGRGGGSLEDLWAFNEEVVARAISNSKIPIISAVGHEIDWTIADFTADIRAATPSRAAELVIPRKEDLRKDIENALLRLKNALLGYIDAKEAKLKQLSESYIFRQPLNMIIQYEQRLDDLLKGIQLRIAHIVNMRKGAFEATAGKLHSLSPFAVLERGYSITAKLPKGETIKNIGSIKRGDKIKTKLSKGSFISTVERIEGGEDARGKI